MGIGVEVAVGIGVGLGVDVGSEFGKGRAVDVADGGTAVGEIETTLVLWLDASPQEMANRIANVSVAVSTWGFSRSLRCCLILG